MTNVTVGELTSLPYYTIAVATHPGWGRHPINRQTSLEGRWLATFPPSLVLEVFRHIFLATPDWTLHTALSKHPGLVSQPTHTHCMRLHARQQLQLLGQHDCEHRSIYGGTHGMRNYHGRCMNTSGWGGWARESFQPPASGGFFFSKKKEKIKLYPAGANESFINRVDDLSTAYRRTSRLPATTAYSR